MVPKLGTVAPAWVHLACPDLENRADNTQESPGQCYALPMQLLGRALSLVGAGDALALVTVIRVSGSAPRHVGAKMLVDVHGNIVETIGGGRVELEVTQAAAEVAGGGPARRVRHHLVRDLAMCCGGTMEFYIEPLAQSRDALAMALSRWQARKPVLLVTPLDGSPKLVRDLAAPPAQRPACELEHDPATGCESLVEPIWPPDRVLLFGAGHVGRAVGAMAAHVGFEVVVCDDDDTGALSRVQGEPWVSAAIDSFDIRDIEAALGPLGPGDHALILTRDHAVDQAILEKLLCNESLTYLGLIGSRGKVGRFHKRLVAKGIATDERWARLHAPIGLDIGAETPEEIAVSVMAELVLVRRRGGR